MNNKGIQYIGFLFLVVLMMACKTQKMGTKKGFHNEMFGIVGIKCTESVNPNAVDSKVGTIQCDDISLAYDYGLYSNPGPLTPVEEVTRAFDSYHHVRFFEDRLIDPKVYKIFLDSVQVQNVRRKTAEDKPLFDCEPCNTVAELAFMGDIYLFPTTMSDAQLNKEGYESWTETKDGYIYKYYTRENENPGLYIAPIKNRYKTKNTLSLIVTACKSKDQAIEILQGVYMIEKENK